MRRAIPLLMLGFTAGVLLSNAMNAPLRAKALKASQQFDELVEITQGWRKAAEHYRELWHAEIEGRDPFPQRRLDFDDINVDAVMELMVEADPSE